jgi:hypothetical protein
MRWFVVVALAAGAVGILTMMPPTERALPASAELRAPVRGAIHIHTRRSDGTGTVDDVAAAASRAGLNFIVLTDHGDGTREPDSPAYRHGVLCIDAVEISTAHGHLVALGLPRAPYSLGGEARDVVEDVRRLGGMAIAAHPSSARAQLRWTDWNVDLDGLEWANADSEWRDEPLLTFARTLLTYPFRRPEALATLLDRPQEAFERWDALSRERPIVAVAASDAHARIALTSLGDPYDNRISIHLPSYESIFRTFSIAIPGLALTGEAKSDSRAVLDAIRRGGVYSSIDALAGPVALSFSASDPDGSVAMGQDLIMKGPTMLVVQTNSPESATITLLRNGQPLKSGAGPRLEYQASEAGVYRVEMQWPGAPGQPPVPWVVTNPIYLLNHARPAETIAPPEMPKQLDTRYANGPATAWHVENSTRSRGALDVVPSVGGTQLLFRYALGGTEEEGPFAALSMTVPEGLANYGRLVFTAQSSRPTRIWVQLRAPGQGQGRSWHQSAYVDETPRTLIVPFDAMQPLESTTTGSVDLPQVRDILFVVDTINTRPGVSGQLWLDEVRLGR